MKAKSQSIAEGFKTHLPSSGQNKEDIVKNFLEDHLPTKFGITTGLIITSDEQFSNEADLIIVDKENNAPLHSGSPKELWPVEACYSLIEVKSTLSPADIADVIRKCKRFKQLKRKFVDTQYQAIKTSLFIIWAFDAPKPNTVKENLMAALKSVPTSEQPDFLIVPGSIVGLSGEYLELTRIGDAGSSFRADLEQKYGHRLRSILLPEKIEISDFGGDALLAWYVWLDSWLRRAGSRMNDPTLYVPPSIIGKKI